MTSPVPHCFEQRRDFFNRDALLAGAQQSLGVTGKRYCLARPYAGSTAAIFA
jgi:hypothetical protein